MSKVKLPVSLDAEFHERLKRKSAETGIPLAAVARRAWEIFLVTGILAPLSESEAQSKREKKGGATAKK